MIDPKDIKGIAQRQSGIVRDLSGMPQTKILSPAEQMQQYAPVSDPSWVDEALTTAKHPAHKKLLQTIKKHGLKGTADWIQNMEKMKRSG